MPKVEFVVPREGESTVTIVKAWVSDPVMREEKLFLEHLTKALTKWALTNKEGARAWKESSHDFNIGDFAHWYLDADLMRILMEHKISELEILIYGRQEGSEWMFDRLLMDSVALEEKEEE